MAKLRGRAKKHVKKTVEAENHLHHIHHKLHEPVHSWVSWSVVSISVLIAFLVISGGLTQLV